MNFYQSLAKRRILALFLLTALLLPLLSSAVFAEPEEETPAPLPVWNGGSAESFAGAGTEADPYLIATAEELALLAQRVRSGEAFEGAYFLLTADLCLNDTADFDRWAEESPQRRWIPIGGFASVTVDSGEDFNTLTAESGGLYMRTEDGYLPADAFHSGVIYYRLTAFSGIFNGDGHSIYGLYSQGEPEYAGLFGACNNATIRNLTLASTYVSGNDKAGGLAGSLYADTTMTVDNCHVSGTICGNEDVGGLIGYATSADSGKLIVNASSFSAGTVSGNRSVGGILGTSAQGSGSVELTACENLGTVTAKEIGGGILGHLAGENDLIDACFNRGVVICNLQGGGIIGLADPKAGISTVNDCQNGGTLLGEDEQGGIIGKVIAVGSATIEILDCRNIGEVHGNSSVGGITGSAQVCDPECVLYISTAKNSAVIGGSENVGGIIGIGEVVSGSLTVSSCENYGNLTGTKQVGGIIGSGHSQGQLLLSGCSGRASITATLSHGGGIAGQLTATVESSIRLELTAAGGTVKAPESAGGIVGEILAGNAIAQQTDEDSDAAANADDPAEAAESTAKTASVEVRNCLSAVTVSADASAGGIVGLLTATDGSARIASSLFCGNITAGCKVTGGIAAIAYAQTKGSIADIADCYYHQSTATKAVLLKGGRGSENCSATVALAEEALRRQSSLPGLDFTATWCESAYYPTLQAVPFVWEEYAYTVTQSGAILLAYTGRSDIARIPDKLGGIAVTTISQSTFADSNVVRVILPDSINTIGEGAFAGCQRLERVTLSASLVSVGARAFAGCSALSELRCSKSLSTLQVGSENEPFSALTLTHPVTLQVSHVYEDGSAAGKNTSVLAYVGDYYHITPLDINGYEPDLSTLDGVCDLSTRISVLYRIGTYQLTIRYLFPDGSEAFPDYQGSFQFGQPYSIPTPTLEGYIADRTLLEGVMDGENLQYTIIFTEVFANEEDNGNSTWRIALLILSGLVMVCCAGYFIHRYRVVTDLSREEKPEDVLAKR